METVPQMLCLQIAIVSAKQVAQPNGAPAKKALNTCNDMCQCIDCTNCENELDESAEWSSDDENLNV